MAHTGSDNPPRSLTFGRYVLDTTRGCLLSDGSEIPLRPKTFAVLSYLAHRPGQLVTNEDLFDAVWPGLIVTDDTLAQSISELRRTLGDAEARLITTVPNSGYRFDVRAAPPERRRGRGLQALRWRWKYGLAAPLIVAIVFVAIWWLTPNSRPVNAIALRPAIAILPFQNQSEDAALAPQADVFTQGLIESLGRHTVFAVRSWQDVSIYKGILAQPGEVARVLAVRFQVQGSVRYVGEQLQVSAQLTDVPGKVLWSARYAGRVDEVAALQERIAGEISAALAQSH